MSRSMEKGFHVVEGLHEHEDDKVKEIEKRPKKSLEEISTGEKEVRERFVDLLEDLNRARAKLHGSFKAIEWNKDTENIGLLSARLSYSEWAIQGEISARGEADFYRLLQATGRLRIVADMQARKEWEQLTGVPQDQGNFQDEVTIVACLNGVQELLKVFSK